MKVKMLVAMAVSSLLAVSFVHAAPLQKPPVQLTADDPSAMGNQDNGSNMQNGTNPGGMNDSSAMPSSPSSPSSNSPDNSNATGSSNDEGSADTAPDSNDDSDY